MFRNFAYPLDDEMIIYLPHPASYAVKAPALVSAVPLVVSTKSTHQTVNMVPSDTEEDNSEEEVSSSSSSQALHETANVDKTPSPVNADSDAVGEVRPTLTAGNCLITTTHYNRKPQQWIACVPVQMVIKIQMVFSRM